ncbi:MAG TPA: Tox-REase-5 domain-containing protein [Myxococcaceae bacterium]|nr:Tox-REase-5 domain-containing protein [Myxococcaceae bacterium]
MSVPPEEAGTGGSGFFEEEADAFQVVQEESGLEEGARLPVGATLSPQRARALWEWLGKTSVTARSFAPRLVLSWLLREALAEGEPVAYPELLRRAERFGPLVVVRPDGYLVAAPSGRPLQSQGKVRLEAGEFKVGRLVVGAFYYSSFGVLYPVDESLQRMDTEPWAELGLERDWLNAALDGAESALGELALALAESIRHPIRTVEGLEQLPDTVKQLIASSPEYFQRYGVMSLQDQIREAARLSTHLLLMYGNAAGTAGTVGRIGALGAEVPVLVLTAEGTLVVSTVAVSAGTVTTTLGAGAGAVSILHMAAAGSGGGLPPPGGPGQWVHKTPTTKSKDALDYQEQVTGRPASQVYMIGKVEFDGFTGIELQEAKGSNYVNFFNKDGTPKYWYVKSGKFDELIDQAKAQSKMAKRVKLPLVWHVADAEVAKYLRVIFRRNGVLNIDVRHTPPRKK